MIFCNVKHSKILIIYVKINFIILLTIICSKNSKYLLVLCFTNLFFVERAFLYLISSCMWPMNNKYVKQYQDIFCIFKIQKCYTKLQQSKLLL